MVLPIHDLNPTRRTPVVTYVLLLLNVAVFLFSPLATQLVGSNDLGTRCETAAFLERWGAVPEQVIGNDAPQRALTGEAGNQGGQSGCFVRSPPGYDKVPVLSVLTSMFVHAGWLHLLGNLLFLYVFGNNVEDRLGRVRFTLFYLFCGAVATYGFSVADAGSDVPLVGASGAIAGVLGAYLVLFPRAKVWSLLTFFFFLPVRLPAWLVLGGWFALQFVYSRGLGLAEGGGVAYLAHVIGFVVGALLVLPLRGSGSDRQIADVRFGPYTRR